ncbi:hypothetical protein [Pseudomonas lurida]|jgi:ribosome biogenesis protein Nip4|uniref:hypothetical protein n=1 Tax=Pseudomonas lurida TaxID=244566 RepID=UPI0030B96F6A
MNDLLATGKAAAEAELIKTVEDRSRANVKNTQSSNDIIGLIMISSQNEHLIRQNQRLMQELRALREPPP